MMIRLRDINKGYRHGRTFFNILRQVSLDIAAGDFVGIMGPSGCGKTTLLNILGALDHPESGSYLFEGTEVFQMKEHTQRGGRQRNIGFIFQNFNLISQLTVAENIMLPLTYLPLPKAERQERAAFLMQQVGMYKHAGFFPGQLSGGQQQRVAIARAIAGKPRLILADEPTGNLDSKNGNQIMEILSQLNDGGTTLVMVTHSDYDARYAKRIVYMQDGCLLMEAKNQVPGTLI